MARKTAKAMRVMYLLILTGVVFLLGSLIKSGGTYKKMSSVFLAGSALADIPAVFEGGTGEGGTGEGGTGTGTGTGGTDCGGTTDPGSCTCGPSGT